MLQSLQGASKCEKRGSRTANEHHENHGWTGVSARAGMVVCACGGLYQWRDCV